MSEYGLDIETIQEFIALTYYGTMSTPIEYQNKIILNSYFFRIFKGYLGYSEIRIFRIFKIYYFKEKREKGLSSTQFNFSRSTYRLSLFFLHSF